MDPAPSPRATQLQQRQKMVNRGLKLPPRIPRTLGTALMMEPRDVIYFVLKHNPYAGLTVNFERIRATDDTRRAECWGSGMRPVRGGLYRLSIGDQGGDIHVVVSWQGKALGYFTTRTAGEYTPVYAEVTRALSAELARYTAQQPGDARQVFRWMIRVIKDELRCGIAVS